MAGKVKFAEGTQEGLDVERDQLKKETMSLRTASGRTTSNHQLHVIATINSIQYTK